MATTDERRQADEASQDAAGASASAHARAGAQPTTASAHALTAAARCEAAYEGSGLPEIRTAWATAMDAWVAASLLWTRAAWEGRGQPGTATGLWDAAAEASHGARLLTADAVRLDADAERARWS